MSWVGRGTRGEGQRGSVGGWRGEAGLEWPDGLVGEILAVHLVHRAVSGLLGRAAFGSAELSVAGEEGAGCVVQKYKGHPGALV